ncbi:MAG: hypothetical protein AAF961_17965, partial [Planctomycetota bacterium]
LACDWGSLDSLTFSIQLVMRDGRFEHPALPRPLTDVHCAPDGEIVVSDAGVRVERLRARSGLSEMALSLFREGWADKAPISAAAQANSIALDAQLYAALPRDLRDQWDKYRPEGVVRAEVQGTFDGRQWGLREALLSGEDLSFESAEKFPYRLNNGSGSIRFQAAQAERSAQIDIDLIGFAAQRPIRIVGQVFDPRPEAPGWVEISGQEIPIESGMIEAMRGKARDVIASLHPVGKVDLAWRFERGQQGAAPEAKLRLDLKGVSIKYDRFPYPLEDVRGVAEQRNGVWMFSNLQSGGRREIRCNGSLQPCAEGSELFLQFAGRGIPLNDDLYYALQPPVQLAWRKLRPTGSFDLQTAIRYRTGQGKPSIRATISPNPDSSALFPLFFPYRMERLSGD